MIALSGGRKRWQNDSGLKLGQDLAHLVPDNHHLGEPLASLSGFPKEALRLLSGMVKESRGALPPVPPQPQWESAVKPLPEKVQSFSFKSATQRSGTPPGCNNAPGPVWSPLKETRASQWRPTPVRQASHGRFIELPAFPQCSPPGTTVPVPPPWCAPAISHMGVWKSAEGCRGNAWEVWGQPPTGEAACGTSPQK